jgi:hypothetical protein
VSCTEWKRRSCCWALAGASCTNSLGRAGCRRTVTEGRVRLIPAAAIDAYVSLLTIEARAVGGDDAA